MRRSLYTASRIEYQVKNTSRKINATIGTLSGLVMIRLKFSSVSPNPNNAARKAMSPQAQRLEANDSRFQMIKMSAASVIVKK